MSEPVTPELRWFYCLQECEWMAFWIGPHRHLLREDGTMGVVLERLPPADVPVSFAPASAPGPDRAPGG